MRSEAAHPKSRQQLIRDNQIEPKQVNRLDISGASTSHIDNSFSHIEDAE